MTDPKLTNDNALALQTQVSPARWERVVQEAQTKALVYEAVAACHAGTELSWRKARQFAAPLTPWPTFVRYKRRAQSGEGPLWERLLDLRVPPDHSVEKEIRAATCDLRRIRTSACKTRARR